MQQLSSRPRQQRGVTLIVALVMLVIIGLTSAAVMRGAMSADTVANNSRLQTLAQQTAQIALRYCESQLELAEEDRVITVQATAATEAEQAWLQFDNWHGSGAIAADVPAALLASDDSSFAPGETPQCLAEGSPLGASVFIVTARGFSPGYEENTAGRAVSGSVVWLQSTVRLGT